MTVKTVTQTIIYADDGMVLTDGEGHYGSYMRIADSKSADDYTEIALEEYEAMMAEEMTDEADI